MSIEARVEQLERMARAVDSILDDLVVNGDWKTTKQRHGVARDVRQWCCSACRTIHDIDVPFCPGCHKGAQVPDSEAQAASDGMEGRWCKAPGINTVENVCAFARSEIARATAPLRAEVGKQTQRASEYLKRCDEWIGRCSKVEQERAELRTRLAACEEALKFLIDTIDAHETVCRSCDRDRKITCDCMDRAADKARAALKEPSRGN